MVIYYPLPPPRKWQLDAYYTWYKNNYKGIISAGTGVGKTYLGCLAIQQLKPTKTLIVVPTIHLQDQWKEVLQKDLLLSEEQIGLVGNQNFDLSRPITIAVINSIRYDKLEDMYFDLLIMDEYHRIPALVNRTFLKAAKFDKIMGLSATPEREDNLHTTLPFPIIYKYNQIEAIQDGLLVPFIIINKGVTLTPEEEESYRKVNSFISTHFPRFGNDFNLVKTSVRRNFIAASLMKNFSKRKQILLTAENKINKCVDIILEEIKLQSKIIVFNEFIEMAQRIKHKLDELNIISGLYHSKLKLKERKQTLQEFKEDKFNILISVKALDEGVNIPKSDVAIIIAGSGSERQQIQRIGRVLRKGKDKTAKIYQVYVKSYANIKSQEMFWLYKRTKNLRQNGIKVIWD